MDIKTFLLLGGYGSVGRVLARLLLQETNVNVIIAGRNIVKTQAFADELNTLFVGNRATAVKADASDVNELQRVFAGVDLVLVVSSTSSYTKEIAQAAMTSRCDCMDIHVGNEVYTYLRSQEEVFKNAGRCFITGGGFHPGLPAAIIRYANQYFDTMEKAIVGGLMNVDFCNYEMSESTLTEFVKEVVGFQTTFYKNDTWHNANWTSTKDFLAIDFEDPYGKRLCTPLFFEELREVPSMFPALHQTGFYMAGLNWFVDYVVFPVIFISLKIFPTLLLKPMSRLLHWGLKAFSKPPYGLVLKLEASGKKNGLSKNIEILFSHQDGSYFTAVPVVACLLQYLDGTIRKPGVWLQAHLVEPNRFVGDMKRMGIEVRLKKDAVNAELL